MGVVRLRLARFGRRNLPFYRIFAADSRFPRDGRHLEILGHYDPLPGKDGMKRIGVNSERIKGLHVAGTGYRSVRSLQTLLPGCCTRLASCHRHQQSAPHLRAADTPGCPSHKSSGAGEYWKYLQR
eukprot:SM000007S20899  [mRNA]  locus=s7:871350:872417:+ [translate_table: standard]